MDPFFSLDDVWVTRENRRGERRDLLAGVTLDVPRGACWAVVGASGSGKSTLLRLLDRLIDPTRGEVRCGGSPLAVLAPARLRREVALVFQEPVWLPGTARDNLLAAARLGLVPSGEAEARLPELLGRCGLDRDLLDRDEDALSVGQRQRVVLGRALMTRPRALLLDEPTAALDPPGARALLTQVLRAGEADDLTMLLVTHRLDDARQFGAETVVLDGGRIVETGPTPAVLARLERRWNES